MTKRTRSESIYSGRLDDNVVHFLKDAFEEYEETFIDNDLSSIKVIPDGEHKINRKIININNKIDKTFYNEEISNLVIEGSWKDNKKNGNFTITKYITSLWIYIYRINCKFIDDTIVQNESDGLTRVDFRVDFNDRSTFFGLISEFDESNGGHFSLINGTLSFNQGDTYYKGDFENWKYNGTGHYFTINNNDGGNDFGFTYTGKFLNNKFINGCIHVIGNFNDIRISGDFSNQTSLLNLDGTYSVELLNEKFHDGDSESDVDSDIEYDDDEYKKYSFKIKFSNNALTRDIEEGCVYCDWCRDTVQGINLTNYNLRSKGITENTLDTCLFCREEKPLIVFEKCRHKLYCIDCIRMIVDRKYEKLIKKVNYLFESFTICCDKFLTLKE